MTEEEKLKRLNTTLKDTVAHTQVKMKEFKAEIGEMQEEIKLLATQKSCPALQAANEEIEELKKQLKEMQDFQRNSLVEGQTDE